MSDNGSSRFFITFNPMINPKIMEAPNSPILYSFSFRLRYQSFPVTLSQPLLPQMRDSSPARIS